MKYVRTRRGLSTVVTSAIMLTFVAVLGTAMVGWSNGNLKAFENSLANTSVNMTNKINENLVIENVSFCKQCSFPPQIAKTINVTLSNTGSLSVKITQIQVNGTIISSYDGHPAQGLPTNILPGQSYTVEAHISNAWASKKVDTITVTTQRGTILTTQAAPP